MTRSVPHPPAGPSAPPSRALRALRLQPDERIAPYITRIGRFRRVDPLRARSLPSLAKVLGVLGWVVLLGESFRRAVSTARAARDDQS